ncbi:carbohydrate ABC transporter permease [Spirochaeta cellobiosiphila]|uniref:carbohydrate ABC transporter permease n=1 Tax=Spirochaeta cellobiosiphila TaxID=504483 RepID=UPI00048EC106|nr:sugar ABC transporter permease [Spirochaeta cellobiosiphila]
MTRNRKEALGAFVYILPSLLLITIFAILPIVMNIFYSFHDYNIIQPPSWSGLSNYKRLINDPYIVASIKNTVIFTFITVPLQTLFALVLAALLVRRFHDKFTNFIKGALFIPVIASAVLVGTLWSIILSSHGVVNQAIELIGLEPINWLGRQSTSLLSICIATIWKNVGYFLVIFYAGILEIPTSLYEAASVDGASKWQQFIHITIPGLSSVTYLVVTLGTIWSFQIFDMVYTMTGGGPGLSTVTLVLTIYNTAFKEYSMGYASAIALLMFVFVILLSQLQRLIMRKDG